MTASVYFGRKDNLNDPGGYVATPLDGLWASSPYFHNGSVPTLWHGLTVDQEIDPAEDFYLEGHSWLTPPVSPPVDDSTPNVPSNGDSVPFRSGRRELRVHGEAGSQDDL